jgi:hypothetical protein
MHYDGTTATLFINNVSNTTGTGTMTVTATTLSIGVGTFGESAGITAYEVLAYNRALTLNERNTIHSYLNSKWLIY